MVLVVAETEKVDHPEKSERYSCSTSSCTVVQGHLGYLCSQTKEPWRRALLSVARFVVPSAPWYPDASEEALPIRYGNTRLPKQMLEIAHLDVQTWGIGIPTPCC